jgi:hypothetical protein
MLTCLVISLVAGIWYGYTGPAFAEHRRRRRETADFPLAKVTFLLPSACRHDSCMEDPFRLP